MSECVYNIRGNAQVGDDVEKELSRDDIILNDIPKENEEAKPGVGRFKREESVEMRQLDDGRLRRDAVGEDLKEETSEGDIDRVQEEQEIEKLIWQEEMLETRMERIELELGGNSFTSYKGAANSATHGCPS